MSEQIPVQIKSEMNQLKVQLTMQLKMHNVENAKRASRRWIPKRPTHPPQTTATHRRAEQAQQLILSMVHGDFFI